MEFSGLENMTFRNAFEVLHYVVYVLNEAGMSDEINDYLKTATADSNYNLFVISSQYLNRGLARIKMLNNYDDLCDNNYDEYDVELEAYEGFDSCEKTYWDSSEYDL